MNNKGSLEEKFDIDIEKIMEEIRNSIKEKNISENDIPSFESIAIKNNKVECNINYENVYKDSINYINNNFQMEYYFELGNNPIKVFIKRAIRKILKFLFFPAFNKQTDFNFNIVNIVNEYDKLIKVQNDTIKELNKKIIDIEDEVKTIRNNLRQDKKLDSNK